MVQDVTETPEWFNAVAAPLLICRDGVIVAANRAAEKLWALPAHELRGRGFGQLFVPDDAYAYAGAADASRQLLTNDRRVTVEQSGLLYQGQPATLMTFQDVTDLYHSEAELSRHKSRFYAFADDLPDIFCRFLPDERWTLTFVNDAFCEFFGGTRQEFLGASYFEVMPNSDIERAREHISILTPQKQTHLWEHMVMPMRDGSIRWHQWRDRAFFDSEGCVIEYQSIGQDITERKVSEETLRRSENLLQEMGSLANVGGWEVDRRTNQLSWTAQMYHINEVPLNDPLTLEEAIHFYAPESIPVLMTAVERLVNEGLPYELELEAVTATGKRIWAHTLGVPHFEDGEVVRISGAFQDITARKQAEMEQRLSEERLRKVVDNLPVVLFTLDKKGVFTFASGVSPRYDIPTIVGHNALALYKEDKQFAIDHQTALTGQTVHRERQWMGLIYDTYYIPLYDDDGNITGTLGLGIDITERKFMEDALRDNEQRYRVLFEQATDAIMILDLNGNYVDVNGQAVNMLGYSRNELLQMTYHEVVSGDEADIRESMEQRLLAGEDVPTYERRYKRRDGTIFPTEIKISLIKGNVDSQPLVQSIIRDITERKSAEEALRQSQRRYQSLFDQARDAIFILNMDGIHMEVNAEAARMLGYTRQEMVGQSYEFTAAPGEESKAQAVIEGLKAGKRYAPYERLFRHRDGRIIAVEINVSAILDEDGNLTQIQSIARDITERKQAEAALRASEERYRIISSLISDYAFRSRFGPDGRAVVEWVTDSYTRVVGYTQEEISRHDFFTVIYPDDRELLGAQLDEVRAKKSARAEYRITTKSGDVRWIHGHRQPIIDELGQVTGFYTVAQDITERRQAEMAMRERERLQVRLEQEMELSDLKTKMMQRVSHEFRTPLSVILTSADLLERHYDRLPVDRREARFAQIVAQINQMTRMLDDLALAVRGQFSHMEFRPLPFDLEQLCQNLVQDTLAGPGSQHHILFEGRGALQRVVADSALIRLIVNNLLSNAVKYSPVGKTIYFEAAVDQEGILLRVRDEGIGIAPEDKTRIFDAFYRGSNFDERPGLGLGLSIVKDAVARHQGDIQIESEPENGTTVTIWLPIVSV